MREEYWYAFTNPDDSTREFCTDTLLSDEQIKRIAEILSEEDDFDQPVTTWRAVVKIEYTKDGEKRIQL